jgi:hypothetical protein
MSGVDSLLPQGSYTATIIRTVASAPCGWPSRVYSQRCVATAGLIQMESHDDP